MLYKTWKNRGPHPLRFELVRGKAAGWNRLKALSWPEGCSGKLIETDNDDYVLEGEFNPDKIPEGGYRESIWIATEDDIGKELLRFDVEVAAGKAM
jgi:hypothetical protein